MAGFSWVGLLVAVQLTCTDLGHSPFEPVDELPAPDTAAAAARQSGAAGSSGTANTPPAAAITEPVACDSLTCTFDGTGSSDSDGSIARYRWNNGDGGRRAGATLSTWETTYRTAGTYTASLVVTDDGGATDTARVTLTVPAAANAEPVAGIGSSCLGLACSFWSTSTDDEGIASYAWDFGDDSEATDSAAVHTYGSAGMYDVTLVVADSASQADTATASVTVTNLPPVALIAEPVVCDSLACTFDGTGSSDPDGSIALYQWQNGQARSRAGPTLSTWEAAYTAAGTYTATLVVTDNAGGADTATVTLTVPRNEPPVASIDSVACRGRACSFYGHGSSDADGAIANWDWRFGDGGYYDGPALPQVSHTYADTARSYEVTLTVTDNGGATDTARTTVAISDPPEAGFSTLCTGLECTFTSTSTDDLGIVSYAWAFGNGETRSGPADTVVTREYRTGGTYTVTLVVADAGGQADTASHTVRLNTPPVAVIDSVRCNGPACSFFGHGSSDADSAIANWDWRFGDGGYYDGPGLEQVSHTYAAADTVRTYTVTLTVTDGDGAEDTTEEAVVISMLPVAAFGHECEAYACNFWSTSTDDDGIAAYAWDFGDETPEATDSATTHTYAAAGAYAVTLRVLDTSGQTASATDTVRVNAPPVAVIAWPVACDSVVCTFDASGSSDADGSIVRYAWDFGDGGTREGAALRRPEHTYPDSVGAYEVALVVIDDGGAADTARVTVTISMPPVAGFTWSCANDRRCTFASTSTDDLGIATYAWDFGDGSEPATDSATANTYDAPGTYDVTLIVADAGGQADTTTQAVRVNAPPVASIDSVSCAGRNCTFYAHGSSDPDGRVVHYAWNYGDGGNRADSMLVSPTHLYRMAGIYEVRLVVADNDGATGSATLTVTASDPPAADFESTCDGNACSFSSTSTDDLGIGSYAWDFGDGTPEAADSAVAHTYEAPGTYDVTLIVTDIGDQTDTATQAVRINARPTAAIAEPVACDSVTCTFDGTGSSDPDDEIVDWAWDFGDGSPQVSDTTGQVAHTYPDSVAAYAVTLVVTDSVAAKDTAQVTVRVPPNRTPATTGSIAARTINLGDSVSLDVAPFFDDPDGDELSYAAASSDATVATARADGATVTVTGVAGGRATITVTATDPGGLDVELSFAVTVNRAPAAVGSIQGQTVNLADSVSLNVARYFSDPDADALTYAASSSAEAFVTARVAGSTVTVKGVAGGSATITVTATDPHGLAAHQTFSARVNRSPAAAGSIPDTTVAAGDSVTLDLAPYFSDPDGDALRYSAAFSDTAVATSTVAGSTLTIVGIAAGAATITVTATDPGLLTADQTFSVTVNRTPETVGSIAATTIAAGDSISLDVAPYFNDPDGDALSYSAASADQGVATTRVAASTVIVKAITAGGTTITVTGTDPLGLSAIQLFSVTVPNRTPATTGSIAARTINLGDSISLDVAPFFDDPDGDELSYAAASSDATVATARADGATVTVKSLDGGNVTITVTATDPGGLAAELTFSVTVNRPPFAAGSIPDTTVNLADSISLNLARYFSDPDGDALRYSAAFSDTAVATSTVVGSTLTIVGTAAGTATSTVTATDPGLLTADQTFSVTVNRAPVVDVQIGTQYVYPTDPADAFDLRRYFSDPDDDALTYSASSSNGSTVTAVIQTNGTHLRIGRGGSLGSATITVTATDGSLSVTQTFRAHNRDQIYSFTARTFGSGAFVRIECRWSHYGTATDATISTPGYGSVSVGVNGFDLDDVAAGSFDYRVGAGAGAVVTLELVINGTTYSRTAVITQG